MKSVLAFLLQLFVILFPACQDGEMKSEDRKILAEWVPFFQKHENLSGIKEGERLAYSYQESLSRVSGKKVKVYPPYLGGWYVCPEDDSKMVITLTDTNQVIKDHLIQMCSLTPERVIFKLCEYSINEISELQRQLAFTPGFYKKWNVASLGHDYKKNRLIIMFETARRDEDIIKLFKTEVSDSPMLDFWLPSDDLHVVEDENISCSVIKMNNRQPVNKGNSGGIVLTSDNQVAGMLVGSNKNAPWVAYV